jgi:hypothetical protein
MASCSWGKVRSWLHPLGRLHFDVHLLRHFFPFKWRQVTKVGEEFLRAAFQAKTGKTVYSPMMDALVGHSNAF